METQIEEYNRIIAKFMGYKYVQENVDLDDCELDEPVVTVYSKVPISVTYNKYCQYYYFDELPNPDFGKDEKECHWRNDWKTLSWATLNRKEFVTELDYHTNWNSLMEVVEKIESFMHPVYISCNTCVIYEKGGKHHGWMIDKYALNKIDAVYEAVLACLLYTPYWRINDKLDISYTFDDEYSEEEKLFKETECVVDNPFVNLNKISSVDMPDGINEIVNENFWDLVSDSKDTITDGDTTWLAYCQDCGKKTMQVVRPGKIQCSNCG